MPRWCSIHHHVLGRAAHSWRAHHVYRPVCTTAVSPPIPTKPEVEILVALEQELSKLTAIDNYLRSTASGFTTDQIVEQIHVTILTIKELKRRAAAGHRRAQAHVRAALLKAHWLGARAYALQGKPHDSGRSSLAVIRCVRQHLEPATATLPRCQGGTGRGCVGLERVARYPEMWLARGFVEDAACSMLIDSARRKLVTSELGVAGCGTQGSPEYPASFTCLLRRPQSPYC